MPVSSTTIAPRPGTSNVDASSGVFAPMNCAQPPMPRPQAATNRTAHSTHHSLETLRGGSTVAVGPEGDDDIGVVNVAPSRGG